MINSCHHWCITMIHVNLCEEQNGRYFQQILLYKFLPWGISLLNPLYVHNKVVLLWELSYNAIWYL
jgi:hypothetical protein